MGLADAIQAAARRKGPQCTVGVLIPALNADDQAALVAALANSKMPALQILDGLHAEGHEMTRSPIERHRRGECSCGTR